MRQQEPAGLSRWLTTQCILFGFVSHKLCRSGGMWVAPSPWATPPFPSVLLHHCKVVHEIITLNSLFDLSPSSPWPCCAWSSTGDLISGGGGHDTQIPSFWSGADDAGGPRDLVPNCPNWMWSAIICHHSFILPMKSIWIGAKMKLAIGYMVTVFK